MSATFRQPTIAELTERVLGQRVAFDEAVAESPVELHEAMGSFRVEPRTAWTEANVASKILAGMTATAMPADWAQSCDRPAASPAVPLASGRFPQQVSDVSILIESADLSMLRPNASTDAGTRSAHSPVKINDLAADLWDAGQGVEAEELWRTLPASPVRSFNLGMAALFSNRATEAIGSLKIAAKELPESTGWQHLAKLYLGLAQMRK